LVALPTRAESLFKSEFVYTAHEEYQGACR
jgi:hypothetical protein